MKFALHGVSYSGTWGGVALPFEQFLDRARAFGYDAVEVMAKLPHISPVDYSTSSDRKAVRDPIESRGLGVACIADYHDWCWDGAHGDQVHHEKELLWLRANVQLAADLNCRCVRTFSGYLHPELPHQRQWEYCTKYLAEGAEYAQQLGVTILLQPHQGFTMHYQDAIRMVKEVDHPSLALQVDPPYVHKVEVPMSQAVEECGDLLRYTVTGGHVSRPSALSLGKKTYSGALWQKVYETWAVSLDDADEDTAGWLKALKNSGYRGEYVGYEICSKPLAGGTLEVQDDMARRSLAFMRDAWDAA